MDRGGYSLISHRIFIFWSANMLFALMKAVIQPKPNTRGVIYMNTKEDDLSELMRLLNVRENTLLSTENVLDALLVPIIRDAKEFLDDDEMKEFCALVDVCRRNAISSVDDMVAHSKSQYDKNFDEGEISAMVDFYRSPTGRKLVGLTPVLVKEIVGQSVKVTKGVADEVFAVRDKFAKQ